MTSKRQDTFLGCITSAINGGAQSARRLLIETFGIRLQFLQAA
jgi:hypothetical protein